jgi:hypothetical protein
MEFFNLPLRNAPRSNDAARSRVSYEWSGGLEVLAAGFPALEIGHERLVIAAGTID